MPALKVIVCRSTGFDHVDLAAAKAKNIMVCNVPTYGENTVAEQAFALLLCLVRNIHTSYHRSTMNNFSTEGLCGVDMRGKTIGIIGGGRIGLHAIKIARGFGMNVICYDVFEQPFIKEILGYEYVPLDKLLKESDFISIHVPYMPATHHLINMGNVRKIKKGAVLINTARGAVVETEALMYALDKGIISKAGLDVVEDEDLLLSSAAAANAARGKQLERNKKLVAMKNVLFTPHVAFDTVEAIRRIQQVSADNINAFFKGKAQNAVK
jgi:D-lactate dehydrogenase